MNSKLTQKVEHVEIDEEIAHQRIDNFLIARLKGVPKSRIYRMMRKGEVRINRGRVKPSQKLEAGDVVRIPPVRISKMPVKVHPGNKITELLESRILYEDEALLVLNKPSGMAVHGGTGLAYSVIDGLRLIRPETRFLELVHRLDRETSGCLIVAKKRSALRFLHACFREGRVTKKYLVLLAGIWQRKKMLVDQPLLKNVQKSGERMVVISSAGKRAQTEFRRVRKFSGATLVEAKLITGRTHQIRVHSAYLGHPVAGDERYGESEKLKEMRKMGLSRLFLHAEELVLNHPETGETLHINAPLDEALTSFLTAME
ncbi:MAG: 23S rRNA pseudouridine(955/2504/2580) synthase RluC [Methylococcales bacterium]